MARRNKRGKVCNFNFNANAVFILINVIIHTFATSPVYPPPTCRGDCTVTRPTIPYIGQNTTWIGNGDIEITLGYSQNNFVVPIKVPSVTGWVSSLLYPTVDRPETYNVTAILQYNGILEPYNMHSLPNDLVPHSADILGNILSKLIVDGEVLPIGNMLTAYYNNHGISLLDYFEPTTLTFVSQDIGGQGQQTYAEPYFGNIRPLSANKAVFNKCNIKLPPAPGAYNGWAPPSTPPADFTPSSTYSCADFVDAYIALAKCNVTIPFQNGEGWTIFFFSSCAQDYNLNLLNADGTSALSTPKWINFLDTIIRPMLLSSKTGTEYMVNASSPSMQAYLSTPEELWDPHAGFPLGMYTTLIPATTPQGMAYLTAAKPPAVGQFYTPGKNAPNYPWTLTVSPRAPALQQYLALDYLRYCAGIVQQSNNVSAPPPPLTPLGQTVYYAQGRLPYMIPGRTAPQFVNLINTTPNLQIVQDLFLKGRSVNYPLSPFPGDAKAIVDGYYNGLFACMGLKNLSTVYCANRTVLLVNFNNLRACSSTNPGDIEYITVQNPGQDNICNGIYFTSYARWNVSRVNQTCTIQTTSTMINVELEYTTFVPPRDLLDGDALLLTNVTFEAVFTLVAVIVHICTFLSAMLNIDFYVTSLESYFKSEINKLDYRSLFIASIFMGTGVWIQTELTYDPITLEANVCGVSGQATVRFWAGLQVAQLFINVIFAFSSMVAAQHALRLLLTAQHDTELLLIQPNSKIQDNTSDKKSDKAPVNVAGELNISDFNANQSDQRIDRIKGFMTNLVDTQWSWFMFFVSGSIQSANMIFAYWIGLQTIANSSEFTSTLPSYILVIEWLAGSFFLGLANYTVFRLYGSPYIRYAIASVLPLCTVFVQWINLSASEFEFKSLETFPSTTWNSTYAGVMVGVFCLVTMFLFMHNGKRVSMSEKDHAIIVWKNKLVKLVNEQVKRIMDLTTRIVDTHRDELANNAFKTSVGQAGLTRVWRPYRLGVIYWSYSSSKNLPIELTDQKQQQKTVYRAAPTEKMLQTGMNEIMASKELFVRDARSYPNDMSPLMLDHPIVRERVKQFFEEEKGTENYLFLEEVEEYKELHALGLEPIASFMIAKAMYLTWFKSIEGVEMKEIGLYQLLPVVAVDDDFNKKEGKVSMFDKPDEKEEEEEKNKKKKEKTKTKTSPFLGIGAMLINVSANKANKIYDSLSAGKAPADLFDETHEEILRKVVDPVRGRIMGMKNFANGNRQINLPCNSKNNKLQQSPVQQSLSMAVVLPSSPVRESSIHSTSSPLISGIKSDAYRKSPNMTNHSLPQSSPLPGTVE